MINLGFYSGRNMPPVYLEPKSVDRILEGISILLMAAAWVMAIVFYYDLPSPSGRLFINPGVMVVLTVMFLWASRAPIRLYNFPVKLNERNYVMQYLIASRFTRVVNLFGNLIFFCGLFVEVEPLFDVRIGFFRMIMGAVGGLLLVAFIGYYIFAFRYR